MKAASSLKEYRRKRNFTKTSEPSSGIEKPGAGHPRRFVIQKHDASRLHYDLRLELGGTLKSWAVPKGMPTAKGEKHLAVHVEDHPISYADFEGTIPKGEYGGGTVMVWDRGTYIAQSETPAKELAGGKLHFNLSGSKLHGEWYLVRLKSDKDWLLIKGGESMKSLTKKTDDTSAVSGRSMKQISREENPTSFSEPKRATRHKTPSPAFVEPMRARLVACPPPGDWLYEIKFDGFRALALCHDGKVQLISRNNKPLTQKFPEITSALAQLDVDSAVIDGEVVALDSAGRSSFQLLQAFEMGEERPPIYYYAFDLLSLNGKDIYKLPLIERKSRLETLLKNLPDCIRFSGALGDDGDFLLREAKKIGLEGLIGKRPDSDYQIGSRSGAWIKLKLHQEQEFVIGGFTEPAGSRKYFGALIVGYYANKKLLFAGKVGTGFTQKILKLLHDKFSRITTNACPFADLPEKRKSRYGQGITPSQMKFCHWLKPKLVCQVRFSEWTRDGILRQPVYLGLREDKKPAEVTREKIGQ